MKKNIFRRALSGIRRKLNGDVTVTGGLELLTKMTKGDLSTTEMLRRYGKSLYVFACVSKIARKIGSIELEMYRVLNSKGEVAELTVHPVLDLLYKPNPFQTKNEFFQLSVINLKCTGDAFWYKVRNDRGDVVELWNLRPDWITVVVDAVEYIKGYVFRKPDGTEVRLASNDVVHFKYPNPLDEYTGMGPLKAAEKRVETEDFATHYQRDFFLNSARPDAVLKVPDQNLTADQKEDIREGWNQRYRGIKNTSKVAILEGGIEYQVISLSQKEMDYIESMKMTRDDILVAFGMPKSVIGITEDVNRANAETGMFIFLSEVVAPTMRFMMEKANEELVIPDFGDEYFLEFVDPTPKNRELELKEYAEGIANNYLLINEVRGREGLAPVRGGWSFYQPLMNAPAGGLSAEDLKTLERVLNESGEANRKTIEAARKKKTFSFRGRSRLLIKLKVAEGLAGRAKARKKNGNPRKKKWRGFLQDEELRKAYARMINKAIDAKASSLKVATNAFADGQRARVVSELKKRAKGMKKISVEVSQIFDAKKEAKVAIELISPYLLTFLQDSGADALGMTAPQEDFQTTKRIENWIKKRAAEFAESVNNTTLEGLERVLAEGISSGEGIRDLSKRVADVYGEFDSYRSERIARTEATAANNEGLLEGFRQSEVATGKEWINSGDGRVRPEHDDGTGVGGEIVGLSERFSNGLSFPEEPNCRCVIGPAFLEER